MPQNNTAIILAAGRGSRLKELSLEQPKPMTSVNKTSIIHNLVKLLIQNGFRKIVVVTGYFAQKLQQSILAVFKGQAEFIFVEKKKFDSTNNIYSLWLAAEHFADGFYLFEADVFCDASLIKKLKLSPAQDIILLGAYTEQMNGTVVELDQDGMVKEIYLKRHQTAPFDFNGKYKTINFYKLSSEFVNRFFLKKLQEHIDREDVYSYYELIIKEAVDRKYPFFGLLAKESKWWEIDTLEDLNMAERIFNKDSR
ncbi:MAG TPA: phosphocholine cytidylyltransferase family protein [Candidatus Aenigmarchaeota archaeon]|nr:phosphocholine cytidylyltransferase family protein [Candidatus Aenigmarchaeota archaeon]